MAASAVSGVVKWILVILAAPRRSGWSSHKRSRFDLSCRSGSERYILFATD